MVDLDRRFVLWVANILKLQLAVYLLQLFLFGVCYDGLRKDGAYALTIRFAEWFLDYPEVRCKDIYIWYED